MVTKEKDKLTTKKKTISGSIPLYSIDSDFCFLVHAHLAAAYMKHTKLLYRSSNLHKILKNNVIIVFQPKVYRFINLMRWYHNVPRFSDRNSVDLNQIISD